MKIVALLIIFAHSSIALAQMDSSSRSRLAGGNDTGWSRKNVVHILISGGGGTDFVGEMTSAALTVVIGKHVMEIGASYTTDGSFTYRTSAWLEFFGSTTKPEEARQILTATYGQRLTPKIAIAGGAAWVERERNIKYNYHYEEAFFGPAGSIWDYRTEDDSYLAAVASISAFVRANSWMGLQFRLQGFISPKDTWLTLGCNIGFGNFPTNDD